MKISELKREARLSLKGNWGTAVALSLIMFLLTMVLQTVIEVIFSGGWSAWYEQDVAPIGVSAFNTLLSILLIPFSIGVYWFYLDLVRMESTSFEKAFSIYKDGKMFSKVIIASIVQGIFVFLWSLLLLIPGIIKALAYSQLFFLLKDHPHLTTLEAITESRRRMNGLKWKYFLMCLSFIGWGILCLFTIGIGFLWLVPYVGTTMAAFYNEWIASQDENENEIVE
ncbi:DUF975 family protein [Peribacillus sp. NPDC097284]|uniref:DUF975 family protein n=1 Tax=Peribacillus sp. NPDC097284 TaxID=3364401 RepID=UPI00382C2DC8